MFKHSYSLLLFLSIFLLISCKNEVKTHSGDFSVGENYAVTYAEGFSVEIFENYKIITLKNPWPGSEKTFRYLLTKDKSKIENKEEYDAVVQIPVKRMVVTSTTHIPSLEMLDEAETLVGFPNLNYISSENTRSLIDQGKILELGKNEDLNTEILIELSPDVVVGFAMDNNNSAFSAIQKAGIPVLFNSDWTEVSPLGKAEWIKFFGLLFDKQEEADSMFAQIEMDYLDAKAIASNATKTPTVISGAMYRDIWYMPQGDSWAAQFIADAKGDFIWKETKGTGSLSLNLESVIDKGKDADIWLGPAQFGSLQEIKESSNAYTQFKAFKTGEVYSYSLKQGATGGSIYFELAPNRPDLVLKDIIKILHPELLVEHDLYFFEKLK